MLELKGVQYHPATSESPVLRGINLIASPGEPLIISGESGSGKTSLVEITSGLASPTNGQIYWKNLITNKTQRRSLCGVVFQFPERHFLGLNIAQELRLGHRRLSNKSQSDVLIKVGLSDLDLRKSPENLSGGQQRRLALAVQLLRKPKVLLLDEPTAGLDWSVNNEILELISGLAKEQILIVVTHEPELFKEWKTKAYKMELGLLRAIC